MITRIEVPIDNSILFIGENGKIYQIDINNKIKCLSGDEKSPTESQPRNPEESSPS